MLLTGMVLYIDDYLLIDDVIEFVGSSYVLFLHIIFLYAYDVVCFRSDVPITIVSMISLVTWDVTCRGWLGPTMVL